MPYITIAVTPSCTIHDNYKHIWFFFPYQDAKNVKQEQFSQKIFAPE
jgi:hypothetical protein